ncbi:MAG TPA: hypothetical protein DCZ75_03370 [Geobacter sp.]|nr:hypothetical protein [Geobacter sp.]
MQIISFDKNNNELGKASVSSDSAGAFSAQLNLSSTGGYVMVTATKDGFTQFNKRIDYTTPSNIELQAALQSVNIAIAVPGSALTAGIGKSSEPSFNFALIRLPDGTRKALAGSAIKAAKAAGGTVETSINIPASSVPGVNTLKGELNAYDPSTQSERFPGSYTGVDSKGTEGRMVSLAFDFMKITDADTGKSLGTVAKELAKKGFVKAADASTTITRYIYISSCTNLFIQDYNTTAPGWQVPVWSLNPSTGKWVFIGEGTIVDASDATIASPDVTGCGNGNYYLRILVSNTEFARSWWNLDHIVFETPKEVCVSGTFGFTNGDPLPNLSLSLYGSNINAKWGQTGSDGTFTLSTELLNKNLAGRNATLVYYDQNGNYTSTDVTLGDLPNCSNFDKTDLVKPCEVSGKLVDSDGVAEPYRSIRLQGNDFYRFTGSAGNGTFSSLVKCGTDITAYIGNQTASTNTFNVNGATAGIESSDDGSLAVLADIAVPNMAPTGYAYLNSRTVKAGTALSGMLSAYDEDGDYPIAWTLNVKNGSTVAATQSGSITANSGQASIELAGLSAGNYTIEVTLTDSKGGSATINGGSLSVSDGARPPVASAYADRAYLNSCGGNSTITLYGSAYSLEGDVMTGAWTVGGAAVGNCSTGTSTPGYLTTSCTPVTVPSAESTTYSFTATDPTNGKSSTSDVVVRSYSSPPYVGSLTSTPAMVAEGASGTARDFTLTAVPRNYDGVDMSVSWSVNGVAISACPDATVANGVQTTCSYTVPTSAVSGDSYTFRFTVSACGKSAYREVKGSYGQVSDTTIVIQ